MVWVFIWNRYPSCETMEVLLKTQTIFIDFVLKQWLVIASGVGLILTALYTKQFPAYSSNEMQVLFILFVLFVVVNGLQKSGLILKIAQSIEKRKAFLLKAAADNFSSFYAGNK